jgi:hypothetical protein
MQRFAKVRLQLPVLTGQQYPDAFIAVPIGQLPVKVGVVQLEATGERLQEKCSALTSRHILPPMMVAEADVTRILSDTCAFVPQLVPRRHDENATPVAAAQEIVVPIGPVRFSVF